MSKNKFKSIPKRTRDTKAIDDFAGGADVRANQESKKRPEKKSQKKEGFYTTLHPAYKEQIQALAFYLRISQREVVEQALKKSFPPNSDTVQEALSKYREHSN